MKIYFFILILLVNAFVIKAQIAVPNTTAVTENFTGMNAALPLPSNWKVSSAGTGTAATWTTATNSTSVTQVACGGAPTTGGPYNWGISAACTDRSAGFMTSGGYASTNALMSFYQNTNANCINTLTIAYDARTFRVNTAAASINFYYSLDGTNWTNVAAGNLAAASFPTGANTYNFGAPTTINVVGISIAGLSIPNGSNFYLKWDVNTTGANSQGIGIDNVSVTAAFATIASKPTTASSAMVFSQVGCNGFNVAWTNGDGANHLVVVSAAAVAGTPTDGTVYSANTIFGSGSAIAAGEYIVYSGSGNSVTITGLNALTTYYVKIFEYNGTNCAQSYLIALTLSGNQATLACCPVLTGAILNSCDNGVAGCDEGDAEVMLFNSGSYSITVSSLPSHLINYFGSTANFNAGTINAYTGTASSNAGVTSSLNSSAGCSGGFIDANLVGAIPAGSTFIMVPSNFCNTNYDFSNLCASFSPIYVVYFSTAGWSSSGNLANYQAGSNPKYITADFSWVDGSCGKQYYTFDAGSEYSGNGASIAFPGSISTSSATPTSPNYYTSAAGGCTLPLVLPISLIEFKAEKIDHNSSRIHFTTASEKNVKQYFVSKSLDGSSYTNVGQQKALNSLSQVSYFVYDQIESSTNTFIYYRLEEEDFNGERKIVGNCFLELKQTKEMIVTSGESEIFIQSPLPLSSIELFSSDGKNIVSLEGNQNDLSFQLNLEGISKGFYLLKITDINEKITIKKIIH